MSTIARRWTVLILVLVAGIAYATYEQLWRDPFAKPGVSWENKTPHTRETIRLLESGHYVARFRYDAGPVVSVSGTWSRDGQRLLLRQDEPRSATRELVELDANGCRVLAPRRGIESDGSVVGLWAYLRQGEPCEFRPSGYIRKP